DSPDAARERKGDACRHDGDGRRDARGRRRAEHRAPARRARPGARARCRADGHRSEDLGAHAVPADARHPQPVRDGWLRLSEQSLAEPDPPDDGARRAIVRLRERAIETRRLVTRRPWHPIALAILASLCTAIGAAGQTTVVRPTEIDDIL